jgi:hypothetical protein
MQIRTLLNQINVNTFIKDYLKANGVQDVDLFLRPNKKCLDNVEDYVNIDEGFKLLMTVVEGEK